MIDIFREVRERVSAEEAARYYGVTFDRRDWALCPFHNDHNASMSFKNGRFRCWVCDAAGDSIDLTGKLFGLSNVEAVRKLNTDFNLGLPVDRQHTNEERAAISRQVEIAEVHKAFEEWKNGFINKLNDSFREGHLLLKKHLELDKLTEQELLALKWHEAIEHWSDCLMFGAAQEQMQIFRERRRVEPLIDKILNHSRLRSNAS